MGSYYWLLNKSNSAELTWSVVASVLFHFALFAILATTTIFLPPAGTTEKLSLVWLSSSSIPTEAPADPATGAQSYPQGTAGPSDEAEPAPEPVTDDGEDAPLDTFEAKVPRLPLPAPPTPPPPAFRTAAVQPKEPPLSPPQPQRQPDPSQKQPKEPPQAVIPAVSRRDEEGEQAEMARRAAERAEAERAALLTAEEEARERAEMEFQAQERARQERLAAQKAQQERNEREQAERARIAREEADRQRREAERTEKARLAQEQAERTRIAREEADRQRREAERAEKARLAQEQAERTRIAREEADRQRREAERAEKARLAQERIERERREVRRRDEQRQAAEKAAKESAERERLARAIPEKALLAANGPPPALPRPLAEPKHDTPPRPQQEVQKAGVSGGSGMIQTRVFGDLKLILAGGNDVTVTVSFREYPKTRRNRPLSRGEAARLRAVTPLNIKTVEQTRETIVKSTGDGIYLFTASAVNGQQSSVHCTIKVYEMTPRSKSKVLGNRWIGGKTVIARVLMPDGIVWEDDAAFSGSIEDSESITKFNTETGLSWKEFRE